MDGIGKIYRGSPSGQLHDLTPWSKHIDFIWEEIHLYVLNKLQRVIGTLTHLHQAFHPAIHSRLVNAGYAGRLVFVHPVSGNTVVGNVLHFLSADLDFDIHMHAEESGMQ